MHKDKRNIIAWLENQGVTNYKFLPDAMWLMCSGLLRNKGLTIIPVKFNNVLGYLDCSGNELTSLEFSPQYVEKSFWCKENKLTNLKGSMVNSIVMAIHCWVVCKKPGNSVKSVKNILE